MKSVFIALVLGGLIALTGCGKKGHGEERVIRLPPEDPRTTLDTAARIGQSLITGGLEADLQKEFPKLSKEELNGVYITWNGGVFGEERKVFIMTGIRYAGSLSDAEKVADYMKSRVEQAIAKELSNQTPPPPQP